MKSVWTGVCIFWSQFEHVCVHFEVDLNRFAYFGASSLHITPGLWLNTKSQGVPSWLALRPVFSDREHV